jgi:hypothetical protein
MARNGSADCAPEQGFLGPVLLMSGTLSLELTLVQISFPGATVLSLSATTLHGNPDLTLVIPPAPACRGERSRWT